MGFPVKVYLNMKLFKRLTIFIFTTLWVVFFTLPILAQSGCCSWHDGVCGCSGGRKLCCDGTLSPSCTCGYYAPAPAPVYYNPQPKAPNITANFSYTPNSDGKTFNILMNWDNVAGNTGYSIALQKVAGGDPGPVTDTMTNRWTFTNIYPGTYYANLKVGISNVWSNVVYWKVEVPKWYAPPTPAPVIKAAINNQTPPIKEYKGWGIEVYAIILFFGLCALLAIFKLAQDFIKYANSHSGVWELVGVVTFLIFILIILTT